MSHPADTLKIGIHRLSFYTSHYCVDLADVAAARGVPAGRFTDSIGQQRMAVPPPGEDIVTLGANAADRALEGLDRSRVGLMVFGTESGIDQSKAAAAFAHSLLGLSPRCRLFEVKQACYGATAGVQMGYDFLRRYPDRLVLVIASDVARYGLGSAGEPTQGAGAVAMVLSTNPDILALDPESGVHTEDVMDFWRPNYRDEALVDGKASVRIYLRCLTEAFGDYCAQSGRTFADFARFCYHLPFTRMGETAHRHLLKSLGIEQDAATTERQLADSLHYNRLTGNSYTASLYLGLCALLESASEDLAGQRLALFSYGSGCMAEFFSGVVQPGYRASLHHEAHLAMLARRTVLSVPEYETFYRFEVPHDTGDFEFPGNWDTGRFRLAALRGHKRTYERVATPTPTV